MLATLAVRLQSLQVGDVLKLALLVWSRTLDLKGAVFSGVFVSSPSTCILFSSDSVPSDFYNTIQRHHIDFVVNPTYIIYVVISCIKGTIISK